MGNERIGAQTKRHLPAAIATSCSRRAVAGGASALGIANPV